MDIKEYFAHWFKNAAEIGKTPADGYEDRINAIMSLTEDIDPCEALNLVRIFCEVPNSGDGAIREFATHFKDIDGFDIHDEPFVFQILSAISLIQVLNTESATSADAVAVALATRTFQWHSTPLVAESVSGDLKSMACRYLAEESRRMRQTGKLSNLEVPTQAIEINLTELKSQVEQSATSPLTVSNAQSLLTSVNKSIQTLESRVSSLVQDADATFKQLHRSLKASREETNIVWWMVGGWSNDLNRPYTELTERQACLVAGKEIADLITLLPSSDSSKGFLHRILSATEQEGHNVPISIQEAVMSAPQNWDLSWLKSSSESELMDFCPLHFGLLQNRQIADGGWIGSFEDHTGMKPTAQFLPTEISYQFCQERLLFRIAGKC